MTRRRNSFQELKEELLSLFRRGVDVPLPDGEFNRLALRIFRFQCRENPAYAGFVRRRGIDPGDVRRWEDVPFLPTGAFKSLPLMSGDPRRAERVFRTSGTTRGTERRGDHHVRDLELYRASLLPNFRSHLLPEGASLPALCLLPSPDETPDSSLSFMMGEVRDRLCRGSGRFFLDAESNVRAEAFRTSLQEAIDEGGPVLLAGTAFAFVHWTQLAREHRWEVTLPAGSRIMETGGYKGRAKKYGREELYARLNEALGVPLSHIVSEYGMTELLSQFYEPSLGREGALADRYHEAPPWVRTRVLDPSTLEPLPGGELGVLAHYDLANAGSVAAVLTEDLGREVEGGFRLLGRSPGAEPRGCSLALEDFLGSLEEAS